MWSSSRVWPSEKCLRIAVAFYRLQRQPRTPRPFPSRHTSGNTGQVFYTPFVVDMSGALHCSFSYTVALRSRPVDRSTSRYRSHPRRSGVQVGVAHQPPGDHDETFSQPVPSFRGEPAEEVAHDARQHHPMDASFFFPAPPVALLGRCSLQRLASMMNKTYEVKKVRSTRSNPPRG